MHVMPALQSALRPFYEFVYPPICLACDIRLKTEEKMVCASCWGKLCLVHENDDTFMEIADRLHCSGRIAGLVSAYMFEKGGTLQTLIHELKYGGMTALGVKLGERLGENIVNRLDVDCITALIPVPLHPTKMRERGYNQSEFICRGIRRVTGLPISMSLLRRSKYTDSQTQLTLAERLENVRNAFAAGRKSMASAYDGTFLLVDDVITTGATIIACAGILADHGARKVYACSVALAARAEIP